MKTEALDRETLINTIWKARGKVALVAEQLGVSTQTIYNYARRYATVQEAISDAQLHMSTLMVDTAETKTFKGVMEGERWAVLYVLNSSPEARRRGWGESKEIRINDLRKLTDEELLAIVEG